MTQLANITDAASALEATTVQSRVPGKYVRAISAQTGQGLVRAARVQADAYVAGTRLEAAAFITRYGMRQLVELCQEEAQYAAQAPLSEGRFRAIVDAYAGLVSHEVFKLGYGR